MSTTKKSRAVKGSSRRKTARRGRSRAEEGRTWSAARESGIAAAENVLARRKQRLRTIKRVTSLGTLVAEGDSWFDYPFSDVLEELEDRHGWDVVSVARAGDRLEDMAYDDRQLSKLERALRKVKEQRKDLKAVLVSGGGNDIAGDEFAMLLNHKRSGLPPLNAQVIAGLFDERLHAAFVSLAFGVTTLCQELFGKAIPILLHGYDRPVPDGRGFLGGFSILPGPWLEPGFLRKGFDEDDLHETTDLMSQLIDGFNDLVSTVAGGPDLSHVHYVDLRGLLSNELEDKKYKKSWANELHPTDKGFQAVAERFDYALTRL